MAAEGNSQHQGRRKKKLNREGIGKRGGSDKYNETKDPHSAIQNASAQQTSFIRKQVDPETAKYFSEIANVIEGSEIDLEQRSVLCGNALEEISGKELQLATDYIISHTLQILLEGCSVHHLCCFLRSCAKDFNHIAMDRSGSHVLETAFKALTVHIEDNQTYSLIEDALSTICKEIVANPHDVMRDCYGSHVLRSLLCLCKGVPMDSSEFHSTKSSVALAKRLSVKMSKLEVSLKQDRFPNLLRSLVFSMLDATKEDMRTLLVNKYSNLVLQTALKLLAGDEQVLLQLIPVLLDCNSEDAVGRNFIVPDNIPNLLYLMKESTYSRLMEVILEVAPLKVYNELFTKLYRNSLLDLSSHYCGNFIVQALISQARSQYHMDVIWEELGTKFSDLFEMGMSGVIASLIATSQRLHSHELKCCQALADAVCLEDESPKCIIPRLLFLDNYFFCDDKSKWSWPTGVQMNVVGSLILQSVFSLPAVFIQTYIRSITSLEVDEVLALSKDVAGARVIEAFLSSKASEKQKRKLIAKFQGHFVELSIQQSGSFTVEKCFNASNVAMREAIVSELLSIQTELSKTKQGPYLLRKLDLDGYAKHPDKWKTIQFSKQSAYEDFFATFGSEMKPSWKSSFLADTRSSQPKVFKEMRKQIDISFSSAANPSGCQFLAHKGSTKMKASGFKRSAERENLSKIINKKSKTKRRSS